MIIIKFICCYVFLLLLYEKKPTCTCFILTVLKVKNCAFEIRTENGVLPEMRFVGLHSLMCHAEREKTLSRASVMPCGSGTCSATLEIKLEFFFFSICEHFFLIFIGQKNCTVHNFLMLNIFCIVIHLPTFEAGLVNCFICA